MGLAAFATVNDRYVFYRHLSTDATSTELDQYGIDVGTNSGVGHRIPPIDSFRNLRDQAG